MSDVSVATWLKPVVMGIGCSSEAGPLTLPPDQLRQHWQKRGVSGALLTKHERRQILLTMFVKPTRDRRAERHEATRTEIVEAAWELVRTEGLAGLSLRDLAQRVGMQAPSLYSYFD